MFRSSIVGSALLAMIVPALAAPAGRSIAKAPAATAKTTDNLGKLASQPLANLPVFFEPNLGQTDASVSYLAKIGNTRLFLTRDNAVFVLQNGFEPPVAGQLPKRKPSAVVRLRTVNSMRPTDAGVELLPGVSNYLIGHDSTKWVSGVPQYAKLKRRGVYPGIDMVFYGNQHQLEYDFVVASGADASRIELAFDGVDSMRTNSTGDLVLATSAGEFIQRKPKVFQQLGGRQVEIAAQYRIGTGKTVRFELAGYDRHQALVIDPSVVFNAVVGSSNDDFVNGGSVAVDVNGNTYVCGTTTGADFPLVNAYQSTFPSSNKIFIFKLNSSGSALLFSTYLGGEGNDYGGGLALDTNNNVYIAGTTASLQYPTVSAAQPTFGGGSFDGVVTELNASGGSLVFSTYLGGPNNEQLQGIAVDRGGSAYVTGVTDGGSFPASPGAYQNFYAGGQLDCVLAKYAPAGARSYATFLGGSDLDNCEGLAIDLSGNAFVTGFTQSANFPVVAAYQAAIHGGNAGPNDAFVTKMNSTGTGLIFSTFFGGSLNDSGSAIAVDSVGAAYITGSTFSKDFPVTAGAFQSIAGSGNTANSTAYAIKFSPSGTLTYSTYLSGNSSDAGSGIAVDASLNAYIVGGTNSLNFPTQNAIIASKPGATTDVAGFATELTSSGTALVYSTFIGGQNASANKQISRAVAVDSSGNAYVVGTTDSLNYRNSNGALYAGGFGLPGSVTTAPGGSDIFVTKISPSGAACLVSVGSPTLFAYGVGSTFPFEVFAPFGCTWSASTTANWLSFPLGAAGSGSASMTIAAAPNSGAARSATVTFNTGQTITINQGQTGCVYVFSPTSGTLGAGGGTGSGPITTGTGCSWSAVSTEPWLTLINPTGSGNANVNYSATANPNTYSRTATIIINATSFTVTQAGGSGGVTPNVPGVVALTPNTGFGGSQTYTYTFSDSSGATNLNVLNVLINSALDGRQACYIAYVRSDNVAYLVDDAGDGQLVGGVTPGAGGSVSNGQCTLLGAGSSVTVSGNTLVLTLNTSFSSSFSGNRVIYMAARDLGGGNTGWVAMGTHGSTSQITKFPFPVGMSPASASGSNSTLTFTYEDATSTANLQTVWALMNTAIDGRAGCYVAFNLPSNALFLVPDNGDGSQATFMTISGTNSLSNSQCTISSQGSSVVANGNVLTITLNMTFKSPAFSGHKVVFMAAQTLAGANSNWQPMGVYLVP